MADYEVIELLTPTASGCSRYRCRPPGRLRIDDPVTVSELAIDASGWHQLADQVGRISTLGNDHLLDLVELGPDLDRDSAGVYLATVGEPGGSLETPSRPLSPQQILEGMIAAAKGVHAMHEAGLTHGSIDGRFVVFTGRGPVLAPPTMDLPPGAITAFSDWTNLLAVDPDLLCGEVPSRSSDIWSLGATLHTALTGLPLYSDIENDEAVTAVQRILFSPVTVDPSLPGAISGLIKACLERDSAKRPETALAVAERLAAAGWR